MMIKEVYTQMSLCLRSLGLQHGSEDVLRVGELVLIQVEVLRRTTDEPEVALGRLNDCVGTTVSYIWNAGLAGVDDLTDASSRVDGDLLVGRVLDIVVRSPDPGVLHV